MAETAESASPSTETKKIINPRVEIDTSPPFESVKEAVDRFGGSGPWIPHHLLRLAAAHNDNEVFDVDNIEEQAVQLERDLIKKEHETLNVLKELETAKRFVEGLKVNLMPELSPSVAPGSMFMELNQAKLNLNKTSVDLAVIQASVESLNKKLRKDKLLLEKMQKPNSEGVLCLDEDRHVSRTKGDVDQKVVLSQDMKQVNFEAEQCKKMTEASRYEVMKAMSEIERTKNSIRMAEMRLNAAKKMEEAAKAVEAIALAERTGGDSGGITLTFEEYHVLTQKAKQAEELCKTKFIDKNGFNRPNEAHQHEVPILEKFEETIIENKRSHEVEVGHHHRTNVVNGNESYAAKEKPAPGFRSTTSMGDVLSGKVIFQDDVMMGRHVENHSERQRISLSQMLREQSRLILRSSKPTDENVQKQYFVQRKKFGFIQMPIPIKQSKKKAQPVNLR